MKPWLPRVAWSILDIGCGPASIDIWLAWHYGGDRFDRNALEIHLLDGDERIEPDGKEQVGYNADGTHAWRDREVGIQHVKAMAPGHRVIGHPADPRLTIPADLILSLRSWGHHYPISTYLGLADRSLNPGGRVILDLRLAKDGKTPIVDPNTGKDGVQELATIGLRLVKQRIDGTTKFSRFVFER